MSISNNKEKWVVKNPIDPNIKLDEHGLGAMLFKMMKKYSDRIFQINAETGEKETYRTVLQNSTRIALEMQRIGITSNDIVCICTNNTTTTSLPILASTFLGAPFSALDSSLSLSDMIHSLSILKPRIIFSTSNCLNFVTRALEKLGFNSIIVVLDGETHEYVPFSKFLQVRDKSEEENFQPFIVKNLFETILITFTSGSIGLSKGVSITHYGLLYSTEEMGKCLSLDVSINYSTPYWISYMILFFITITSGGARIIAKTFEPKTFFQYLQTYKITFAFLSPAYCYELNSYTNNKKYDTSSLTTFLTGGSRISKAQFLELRELFPRAIVLQAYGLTELSMSATLFNTKTEYNDVIEKIMSCGRLSSGVTAKIVDPETNEILGPNQRGELLVKSRTSTIGYYNNPEMTKNLYDEDGFIRTGDIAYFDEDFCFYVVDRIKDMLKYRNWQVIPADLETIIMKHNAVENAIVIGIPNERDGDHPMAIIVLKSGLNATENEILNFVNEQVIDKDRLRGGVKIVKQLPTTITGKISRRLLRDQMVEKLKQEC